MSLPQPVPPSWKDLGKSSNDLLGKDFVIGFSSLEVKTSTPSNVVFRITGTKVDDKATIEGLSEAKYTDRANGITFTQAWSNSNNLITTVELENQIIKGLKLDLSTVLQPNATGSAEKPGKIGKSAIINAAYKTPGIHSRASLNLLSGPTFTADAVFGQNGFLVGTEAAYNVTSGKVTKYAAGLGFSASEYAVTLLATDNLSKYAASYYHRVSRDVEAGGKAIYDTNKSADGVKLEVGTKAYLDSAAFVKAKINNIGLLSLGYTQSLRPGVKATFGLSLDTHKLGSSVYTGPAHKVGASFTFEA